MCGLNKRIDESKQVCKKVDQILAHRAFELDDQLTVAVASLSASLEYHLSISILCEHKRYGASLVLLRSQFESFLKGLWFIHCSDEKDVEKAYEDKFNKKVYELVEDLEKENIPGWEDVKEVKNSYWSILCGYTHTGAPQLARRFDGQNITPNYNESLIISMLNLGDLFAFRSLLELISISSGDIIEVAIKELIASTEVLTEFLNNNT